MGKKEKSSKCSAEWTEANRRCRLSEEDVRMAKELGIGPRSLIKNIPSPNQQWKTTVKDWIRGLYEKKMKNRPAKKASVQEHTRARQEEPTEAEETVDGNEECAESWDDEFDAFSEPTDKDIRETNRYLQRRQQELRRAAEAVATELAGIHQVQKVVLFGSIAIPLKKEVPRFREYRRNRIAVWHECRDVDLAVWLSDLDDLKSLQRARNRALNDLLQAEDIGVAHHQVEMFIMEPGSDRYLGRLCSYGQCPKKGKRDCSIEGCGRHRFLAQHEDFTFHSESLASERSVVLFDRNSAQGRARSGRNDAGAGDREQQP
jgi:hypothetical protein